jgi:hypothetical protein
MSEDRRRGPFDSVGIVTLIVLVLLGLAGWWTFPRVQAYIAFQDCVATGRANCSGPQ